MAETPRAHAEPPELPALFGRADRASVAAQRRALRWRSLDLALLVLAAAVAALNPEPRAALRLVAAGLVGVMSVSLALGFVLQRRRPERPWFDGRVVAESVKTLAYRYMARAEPYDGPADAPEADDRFARDLAAVLGDRARFHDDPTGDGADARRPVTRAMRWTRGLDLPERKAWYLAERIGGQADWYAAKARANERLARRWFWVTVAAKAASLLAAAALVWEPQPSVKSAGFFAGLASAAVAWTQLRQHATLAQSYGLAAQELRAIHAAGEDIAADADFSDFVADAENAISREHTLWRARRGH